MIEDLKPYPGYKKSGVPWLWRIPDHWGISRSKRLFSARKDLALPGDVQLSATQAYGVIPQSEFEERVGRRVVRISMHLEKRRHVEKDDFIISMRSFQGGLERAWASGAIRSSYVVLKAEADIEAGYFAYLFKSQDYIRALQATADFIRDGQDLNFSHFVRIDLPVPPLIEQAAMGRFLDHVNRRIDLFIRVKRKLIALLNEQKQTIIHRAVTRGLDPNVPMKDSGVLWLGDVPQHWEVGRLSQFFTLQRGFDITKDRQQAGMVPVVSSGGVSSYHNRATGKGPGVVVGRKGTAGAVHYVEGDYWAHDTTLWVNDFKGNWPRFIYYVLIALDLKRFDTGSANPTLNRNVIHPERLSFPPPSEQRCIAAEIDSCIERDGSAIARAQREIALLREYRARLIADVVTGQLDVRAAAARLPAPDPDEPAALTDLDDDPAAEEDPSDDDLDGDDPA